MKEDYYYTLKDGVDDEECRLNFINVSLHFYIYIITIRLEIERERVSESEGEWGIEGAGRKVAAEERIFLPVLLLSSALRDSFRVQ